MQPNKLFLLALFSMQSVTSNTFSYFKPWTWRISEEARRKNEEEKQRKIDHLNKMYAIKSEFEEIEKVYKVATAPVSIKQFDDKAFLNASRKNAGLFGTIFIEAQRRWKLAEYIYFGTSINYFKEKVLMPAVEKAETEACVSQKERPISWYSKLIRYTQIWTK